MAILCHYTKKEPTFTMFSWVTGVFSKLVDLLREKGGGVRLCSCSAQPYCHGVGLIFKICTWHC